MKKSDMLFALLRKSTVLCELITNDNERNFLIDLKYQYSKLQPSIRNMIRIMATDIERFEMENSSIKSIAGVFENYHTSGEERPETGQNHPVLIDTVTNNRFVILRNTINVNNIVVFKDDEHKAFVVAFGCLVRAKERQEKIIRENKIEQERLNILSEFI